MNLIDKNISTIRPKHKVYKLFVFGSVLTKKFNRDSDIDLLVDFKGVDLYDYADNYFDLKDGLEKIFNSKLNNARQIIGTRN